MNYSIDNIIYPEIFDKTDRLFSSILERKSNENKSEQNENLLKFIYNEIIKKDYDKILATDGNNNLTHEKFYDIIQKINHSLKKTYNNYYKGEIENKIYKNKMELLQNSYEFILGWINLNENKDSDLYSIILTEKGKNISKKYENNSKIVQRMANFKWN
jgi:hypothetical protein